MAVEGRQSTAVTASSEARKEAAMTMPLGQLLSLGRTGPPPSSALALRAKASEAAAEASAASATMSTDQSDLVRTFEDERQAEWAERRAYNKAVAISEEKRTLVVAADIAQAVVFEDGGHGAALLRAAEEAARHSQSSSSGSSSSSSGSSGKTVDSSSDQEDDPGPTNRSPCKHGSRSRSPRRKRKASSRLEVPTLSASEYIISMNQQAAARAMQAAKGTPVDAMSKDCAAAEANTQKEER